MTKALIVVDVQNDFCEGGSLAVEGGSDVADLISEWVEATADDYELIILTQDWHPEGEFDHFSDTPDFDQTWPPHCVQNTDGADFHPNLAFEPTGLPLVYVKKGQTSAAYSGFEGSAGDTPLADVLRLMGVEHVDVCGIATDYCVKATALDAAALGLSVSVLLPLTAGVAPESTEAALIDLEAAGVALEGDYV